MHNTNNTNNLTYSALGRNSAGQLVTPSSVLPASVARPIRSSPRIRATKLALLPA